MGDLIPTLSNIPIPYVPPADIEPLVSIVEKEEFLKAAAEKNYILIFVHDAANECCTVIHSEKGVVADRSFKLKEVL
jgi:hypothetical protein